MKIERMCHVSSINLTFSAHPTIDNIQSKTNIASYHAYFTYLYPKTRSFMHILAVFYAVFFLLEWIQTIFFQ